MPYKAAHFPFTLSLARSDAVKPNSLGMLGLHQLLQQQMDERLYSSGLAHTMTEWHILVLPPSDVYLQGCCLAAQCLCKVETNSSLTSTGKLHWQRTNIHGNRRQHSTGPTCFLQWYTTEIISTLPRTDWIDSHLCNRSPLTTTSLKLSCLISPYQQPPYISSLKSQWANK